MFWQALHNLYYLNKNRNNLKLSPPEIEDFQFKKLKALVRHAYNYVPYYRNLFNKAGINSDSIKSKDDLQRIPITSKEKMRNLNLYDKVAKGIDINKCKNFRTSGSTGIPLDIHVSEYEILRFKTLPFLILFLDNGCLLTDKILRITHPSFFTKLYWFQRLNILREYFLSIYSSVNEQLNEFIRIKPQAIRGYASTIKDLALKIKGSGSKFHSPKVIFTTAEILNTMDREIISLAFNAEVIDYYCCNEFGIIAWECKKHRGYHANIDNVIIEFVNNGRAARPGEESDILVTGLNNYVMPFIRYKIGDRGIFKEDRCSCGNNSLLIEKIIGRDEDRIILPGNKIISPYLLSSTIKDIPGVIKFQIIQKEINRIVIKIVKENSFTDECMLNRIKKEFSKIFDEMIKIDTLIVEDIIKEKSGKFKVIKNEINNS